MTTKIDLINAAYSRARISGLTVSPSPEDIELALRRLENMAAQWESKNIKTGYNFEATPDTGSVHNVPRKYWTAFETSLAFWLLTDFGKQPSITLVQEKNASFSAMVAGTTEVQGVQRPSRQPRGSGNPRYYHHYKYYYPSNRAPISMSSRNLELLEIQDYSENFEPTMGSGETITDYTIKISSGLSLESSSLSDFIVNFQIKATSAGYQQLNIKITTSTGRVEIRKIEFNIVDPSFDGTVAV